MSNVITKSKGPLLPGPAMTPSEEEDFYFRDTHPGLATVSIEHVEVDRICTLCGLWKSEHPWETCPTPNWL